MSTVERAIEIAAKNHAGDIDKAGKPYLLHPLRLMFAVNTPQEMIAAVLHDVVDDTEVTLKHFKAKGLTLMLSLRLTFPSNSKSAGSTASCKQREIAMGWTVCLAIEQGACVLTGAPVVRRSRVAVLCLIKAHRHHYHSTFLRTDGGNARCSKSGR